MFLFDLFFDMDVMFVGLWFWIECESLIYDLVVLVWMMDLVVFDCVVVGVLVEIILGKFGSGLLVWVWMLYFD